MRGILTCWQKSYIFTGRWNLSAALRVIVVVSRVYILVCSWGVNKVDNEYHWEDTSCHDDCWKRKHLLGQCIHTLYTGVLQVIVRKICRRRKVLLCYAMLHYILCVCSILLLKGSTPDINNSSSHTLGALYHVVVVVTPPHSTGVAHTQSAYLGS